MGEAPRGRAHTCPFAFAAPSLVSSQLPGWLVLIFNEMFRHVTVQELACWWTLVFLLFLLKFQTSMNGSWILWNIFWKLLSYWFLFLLGFVQIESYNDRILDAETASCIWVKSYLAAHCAIFFGCTGDFYLPQFQRELLLIYLFVSSDWSFSLWTFSSFGPEGALGS